MGAVTAIPHSLLSLDLFTDYIKELLPSTEEMAELRGSIVLFLEGGNWRIFNFLHQQIHGLVMVGFSVR